METLRRAALPDVVGAGGCSNGIVRSLESRAGRDDEVLRRPAIRYHGSKFLLARWIISHFPPHDCYVEPYCGGASVLLQKPRSYLEVYNDKDGEVVNFFRVLREQPEALIERIRWTPYAKTEWELAYWRYDDPDPVESARRLYVRAYMSIAGATAMWRSGWRRQKVLTKENGKKKMTPAPLTFMSVDHLYAVANRLRGVQIECDKALAVMERYDSPDTLFYLDPPYPSSVRGRWKTRAYRYEMTDEEHAELARVAHQVEGMVIISGYSCKLYNALYSDWLSAEKKARVNGAGHATEVLWLSPSVSVSRLPLLRELPVTDWGVHS